MFVKVRDVCEGKRCCEGERVCERDVFEGSRGLPNILIDRGNL